VKVVAVQDDGRVEIERDDLKLALWYRDPDHLRSALCFGGRAEWKPKYQVLYAISSGSFNLATLNKVVQTAHTPATDRDHQAIHRTGDAGEPRLHGSRVLVG
jgi:hypothetical protein